MLQLELFPHERDLEKEMDQLKEDVSKMRKALFASQADQKRLYQEIAHEHQIIKLNLCKGRLIA